MNNSSLFWLLQRDVFCLYHKGGKEVWKYFPVTLANITNVCKTGRRKIIELDWKPLQNYPSSPSYPHLKGCSPSWRLGPSDRICRIRDAWACVQDVFPCSEELEGCVQFQRVSSSLYFNPCMEAKFVSVVQLALARWAEMLTKITAFFYSSAGSVSWKLAYLSRFCYLAVSVVALLSALLSCSQCTEEAG